MQGDLNDILQSNGLTASYLNGKETIAKKTKHIKPSKYIQLMGARENNLKTSTCDFRVALHHSGTVGFRVVGKAPSSKEFYGQHC